MNRFLQFFLVCVALLLMAGCKKGPNVEGIWVVEPAQGAAPTGMVALELRKGGTFSMMGRDGFWTQSGDTIEVTPNKTMGVSDAENRNPPTTFKIEQEGKLLVEQGGQGTRLVRQQAPQ